MDLTNQPMIVQNAIKFLTPYYELALSWLLSPQAWTQFIFLIAAFVLAVFANKRLSVLLERYLTPPEGQTSVLARMRRFALGFLPLLLPMLAYAFTAIGETVLSSIFGAAAVIAFGKRVFLFLVVRAFAKDMLTDPMLKLIGKFVIIPVAALYTLGLLPVLLEWLQSTPIPILSSVDPVTGLPTRSLFWLIQFALFGSLIFWLGRWSNDQSSEFIGNQKEMRPATRQLASKVSEILIFGTAFLVLMSIQGIDLTSLVVLGSAVGVGLGFGLQKIASNFISGIILLLEGQATVGDYVELDGGEAGTIVKTTSRAMILETYDGRWIVVPNEDFITTRVVNYSDQGSANRYEAAFSVSYDTDINLIPDIVEKAVAQHPEVLDKPFPPDCELREFGDNGVKFAVEFWVNGIDDGANKYTSDVLFIIWNALKENNITIPFPQRVVEFKNLPPFPDA